jgi:hypothetical protein
LSISLLGNAHGGWCGVGWGQRWSDVSEHNHS